MPSRSVPLFNFAMLATVSCGSTDRTPQVMPSEEASPGSGSPSERCGSPSVVGSVLDVPSDGDNGVFDPSLAYDPQTDRLWMSHSSVQGRAGQGALVTTSLAYSDDRGDIWCLFGQVNEARRLEPEERPARFRDLDSHWNHEVSTLVRDPSAPPQQRWQLFWHRYLEVVDGDPDTDDRRFEYGWIGYKTAATPAQLRVATERKLIAATGYRSESSYNDTVLGSPEVDFSANPDLSECLAFTEPGALAYAGGLFLSVICADGREQSARLLERNPEGGFEFVSTAVDRALAQSVLEASTNGTPGPDNPALLGVSASELTLVEGEPTLIVSPIVENYRGCWFFSLDLSSGEVSPLPSLIVEHAAGTILSGVCDYDAHATETGVLFGEASFDRPQFRLFATGLEP